MGRQTQGSAPAFEQILGKPPDISRAAASATSGHSPPSRDSVQTAGGMPVAVPLHAPPPRPNGVLHALMGSPTSPGAHLPRTPRANGSPKGPLNLSLKTHQTLPLQWLQDPARTRASPPVLDPLDAHLPTLARGGGDTPVDLSPVDLAGKTPPLSLHLQPKYGKGSGAPGGSAPTIYREVARQTASNGSSVGTPPPSPRVLQTSTSPTRPFSFGGINV